MLALLVPGSISLPPGTHDEGAHANLEGVAICNEN
jgi:hypothetical protein